MTIQVGPFGPDITAVLVILVMHCGTMKPSGAVNFLNADPKISAPTGDPHQRQYVFICKSVAI